MDLAKKERDTQNRVAQLFQNVLGYKNLGNLKDQENSNIDETLLQTYLLERGYSIDATRLAVRSLKDITNNQVMDLYQLNSSIYSLLRYGVSVKEPGQKKVTRVSLIDWDYPLKNHFYIAEEVSVLKDISNSTNKELHKRPDMVLYVNGIALVVLELKKSSRSINEGIRQHLTNQRQDMIQSFFGTIGLIIAGNDTAGIRYGVIQTPEKYYLNWKEDDSLSDYLSLEVRSLREKQSYGMDKNLISLCHKERIIELLYNFITFDKGVKKICRPHQFFGNLSARNFIKNHKGGIIWHTQGSGKSLSMVWLSKWIKENIRGSRILIVTDREELDSQIEGVFAGVGEKITRVRTGRELIQKINEPSPVMMCSLIHKFGKKGGENKDYINFIDEIKSSLPQGFRPKGNFIVFVDEAHRTQSGKLHEAMKAIIPDAILIGFTGTPLMKKDKKKSIEVFGPYIHKYKFNEAVKDKVVLDLRYEAREVEQNVTNQQKIDQWFESKTKGLNDRSKARLKSRWGTLQKVFSSKDRLTKIVEDIVFDMQIQPRLVDGRGNALLVADSIYQATRYYELFQGTDLKGKCAIITSYDPQPSDLRTETRGEALETEKIEKYETYIKMLGGKKIEKFEEEVKEKFLKYPDQMKLLIVVDKLLTGFDAPPATYLYIDKKMQDHKLFQAICRVNRLDGEDKEYGYIIDYKDLFKSLEKAMDDYTSEAFSDYDEEDVSGLLSNRLNKAKEQLEESLEALRALCEPVAIPKTDIDFIHYFVSQDTAQPDIEELEANLPKRENLYDFSASALRSFAEVKGDLVSQFGYSNDEVDDLEKEVINFVNARDIIRQASGDYIDLKAYDPDMRQLIDMFLDAKESRTLMEFDEPLVDLLLSEDTEKSDPIINPVEKSKRDTTAEIIENNVKKELIAKRNSNPKYYEKMSQLLTELIEKRKQSVIEYEEYLVQIKEYVHKAFHPENSKDYPENIRVSAAKRAFYDLLNNEVLVTSVHEAINMVRQDGWRGNKIKERKIRRAIEEFVQDGELVEELFKLTKEQGEY
ncbi:type I restriction endonuclease subunit R [Lactococcus formosensis]|uniref:type I restriction endonuclease subunit R n=1 Tax=Lactococcus formosensis TaxID=1281486 RepID=UPI00325056A6